MTQSYDFVSTRTRRHSATAAGKAPRAVDYGFGPCGAPSTSSRRVTTPPQVPRSRPAPPAAATLALVDSLVRTMPLPPDRDHAESMGTAHASLGETPTAPTGMPSTSLVKCGMLILSRVIRMPIGSESSTLSQRDTPQCVTYLSAGHRPCRPTCLCATPRTTVPSFSVIHELAGKGRLHKTYDDIALLVRNITPSPTRSDKPNSVGRAACLLNDEPVRI